MVGVAEDDRLVDNNLAQGVRDRRRLGRGRGGQWAVPAHRMVVMQAAFHQPVKSLTFSRAPVRRLRPLSRFRSLRLKGCSPSAERNGGAEEGFSDSATGVRAGPFSLEFPRARFV